MKKILALLLVCALPVLLLAHSKQNPQPKPLVFTHVTVIDATGAPAKPDMTVVIIGDRITELGKTSRVRVPKDARVVDATGKFLIPGLWDMHVHTYLKDYLPLFIANGVTGVRQMFGLPVHHQLRKEIEDDTLLGPRMVIASPLLDGPSPIWPGPFTVSVRNDAEARQAVNKARQDGADFIKVYSRLPREAFFGVADEAKKRGITFVGHVPLSVTTAEASDAGQKSIEHLPYILYGCSTREEEIRKGREDAFPNVPAGSGTGRIRPSRERTRPLERLMVETFNAEKAAALFARFKRNHTWVCPTLAVERSVSFHDDPNFRNDPRLKYVPSQARTQWASGLKDETAEDLALQRSIYKKGVEIVGAMRRAGVEFLAGTDVPYLYLYPGFSLHDELVLLVGAGLTPMEALQAATLNPARFLGKEKELGTIEKGKLADLVLLDADPLADIRNTQRIQAVVVNGRLLDRKALDELLAQVEAAAKR